MSRSMGDGVAASVGVIAEPEIMEYRLTPEDKFLVLASDGVWEFISNEKCVDIVSCYWS
jgi:serine/threonine protein phosphatase PrpC